MRLFRAIHYFIEFFLMSVLILLLNGMATFELVPVC